jgi:uncharacterized protein (TIGR03083 family)
VTAPALDLPTLRRCLEESYDAIEALGADLSAADWATLSLCPDWTVRGVVEHLAMIEQVMTGWLPEDAATPPSFSPGGAFVREVADLDDAGFLDRVRAVFAARRADLAGLAATDLDRPSWTPVGAGTYGRFLTVRVFDFWVHERDVTTPLGRKTDDAGTRAEIALAEVEGALGYIVGKKVGLPDGRSLVFHLTGPLERDLAVVVDGRAKVVDRVDAPAVPDVEVTTDSLTFLQLACGRIDPQEPIDGGAIRWTGDASLGERAARSLRFTI